MARPQAPVSVTVLGECVADAFTDPARSRSDELALRALPGGGPANTAVALARLGTPTRFLGRFSTDVFGTLFRARLSASGVDLTGSVTAPEPSTLAVADLDETGQATYTFYADSAADTAYRERLPHWCALADILRLSEQGRLRP
jgi:fructokinase